MITKTETQRAIAAAEAVCSGNALSNEPVTITQGVLTVLIEAAKCARYRSINSSQTAPDSGATWVLDNEEPDDGPN